MGSSLEDLMHQVETAKPFNPELIIESLRKMERHVEADLIEAQNDYIKVLEKRILGKPTKRIKRKKNGP